jgi:hypothetical protein
MTLYIPTMDDRSAAHHTAMKIAQNTRSFVRDRFTPGDLGSLNALQHALENEIERAIIAELVMRGMSWRERI